MYESSADTPNSQQFIDLRSDTVTRPSPEMRRAMSPFYNCATRQGMTRHGIKGLLLEMMKAAIDQRA